MTTNYSRDRFGNEIEERVESWTSYGVPHSNTTRRVFRQSGNVQVEDEVRVLRGTRD